MAARERENGTGERKSGILRVFSFGTMPRTGSSPSLLKSAVMRRTKDKSEDPSAEKDGTWKAKVIALVILGMMSVLPATLGHLKSGFHPRVTEDDDTLLDTSLISSLSACSETDEDCIMMTELPRKLEELARISEQEGIINRPYLSEASSKAALLMELWMLDAGMSTRVDFVGNVIGRYEADASVKNPKTIILGSHIDTVNNAGRFDGVYGVLAAIAAIKVLHGRNLHLPFAVEVVAFDDEEGNNIFGTTNTGAKAFSGHYKSDADATKLLDKYPGLELGLRQHLQRRKMPATSEDIVRGLANSARDQTDVLGFIELHIEQGPVLEDADQPIGIVTAINGQTRLQVRIQGQAGHAGTVPMKMRRDALSASAEAVTIVEKIGSSTEDMVATVGTLSVTHGSTNVVPGEVIFSIDIRGPRDDIRRTTVERMLSELHSMAERRGVEMHVTTTHEAGAVHMDDGLVNSLKDAVMMEGLVTEASAVPQLSSGAGHDAMIVGEHFPVAMAFLRCKGGISHSPEEHLSEEDAATGARVLLRFLQARG